MRPAAFAFLFATLTLLVVTASARADITTTTSMTYPQGAKVAQHSDVQLAMNFTYGNGTAYQSIRRFSVDTPAGALGDPQSVPAANRCTADYTAATTPNYEACPASSQVGDVVVNVTSSLLGINLTLNGKIFLLRNRPTASPEIPGYVGIYIAPPTELSLLAAVGINLTGKITARNRSDYGLNVRILEDVPNKLLNTSLLELTLIKVNSLTMRLFRLAPNGSYFATLPTRCEDWTTTSYARAWETNGNVNSDIDPGAPGNDHHSSSSTTSPDCSTAPPFSPGASISPSPATIGQPSSLTVQLTRPSAPAAVVQPHIRKVEIAFPLGVEINPALFNDTGDDLCTDQQFNKTDPDTPSTCPAASEIGTITTTLPLMSEPTVGKMYLGTPGATPADRYRAFIDLPGSMGIKFEGRVTIDEDTGQVRATVGDSVIDRGLPQVPYSHIELVTKGGARGAFVNPTSCGAHGGSVTFTPWADLAPAVVPITLNTDNGAQPCLPEEQRAFNPTFAMTPSAAAADSHDDYEFTITRPDGDQQLKDVAIDLPTGLIAAPANAAECSASDLVAATCSAASQVGTAAIAAGSGSEDFELAGEIHNIVPQVGEVARMAAVVRAVVGPFDLGNVVLPINLSVRDDLGASAQSDPVPQRVGGVAVRIHEAKIKLFGNAANGTFMRAPSRCGNHTVTARLRSVDDALATRTAQLTTSGCEDLPFEPSFEMTAQADPTNLKGDLPAWKIHLSARAGDSAIAGLKLHFPSSVQSNLNALDGLCEDAAFITGNCPPAGTLGTLKITTPLLAYPLEGKVQLVRAIKPGAALPRIGLAIDQPFKIRLSGDTHLVNGNQIVSEFADLPDLPISAVDIDLYGGAHGILQFVSATSCDAMSYELTGHGGQTVSGTQPFGGQLCANFQAQLCAAASFSIRTSGMNRARGKRGRLTANIYVPRRCPAISSLRILLPKGTKVQSRAAKKLASGRITRAVDNTDWKLKRGTVRATRKELRINALPAVATNLVLGTARGMIKLKPCTKKQKCWKKPVTFTAIATLSDGSTWTRAVSLKRSSKLLR